MRQDVATTRFDAPYPDAPSAADAWRFAWPRLADELGGARTRQEMAVLAVDAEGQVLHTLVAPDRFLVIGRHTRCGLRLVDPDVSLRHLVVHWAPAPSPTIRLWDLRTGRPFFTEDAQPSAAVVAEGVLFASVGRHMLIFVPLPAPVAADAASAWAQLPRRRFESARVARHRIPGTGPQTSTVTHTLPPLVFGTEPGDVVAASGRVLVELPEGRTDRWISEEQLDRGLLFGRYDRCQLAIDGDDGLSRVHLLVVRIEDRLWAIDTASTNGTRHNGIAVSASLLGAHASLLLARRCIVHWAEAGTGLPS
jgi:hypothetical protein